MTGPGRGTSLERWPGTWGGGFHVGVACSQAHRHRLGHPTLAVFQQFDGHRLQNETLAYFCAMGDRDGEFMKEHI